MRLDQAEGRAQRQRRRHSGVLQRANCALQNPAIRAVRGRLSDDGHRKGAEVQDARSGRGRAQATKTGKRVIAGGPGNPLGARALYLFQNGEDTLYRIHGTPEAWSIGKSVSSGCIRMLNHDIIDLHDRVRNGARVIVQPSTMPGSFS